MDYFNYRAGQLFCEDLPAAQIAERFGTPVYVYSHQTIVEHYERLQAAFADVDPLICYSIKSCANVHILRLLAGMGSGFDVVSGGELFRALKAGADPRKIVYAGVGKTDRELREALQAGVGWLNIESESELAELNALAGSMGVTPRAALRINPDVDPKTHAYTSTGKKESKFGVDLERAERVFREFGTSKAVRLTGIHLHIGSPVNDVAAYESSVRKAMDLIGRLRAGGYTIDTLDIGGGFGAFYKGGEAPPASEYAAAIVPLIRGQDLRIILEPGRSIIANAGVILARVVHIKEAGDRRFIILDASMNELLRPALYSAYHFIWPVQAGELTPTDRGEHQPFDGLAAWDVVGPICENSDFLAKDRRLPRMRRDDLVAVFTAGAYGMTMASQYNSRPRAAEVLVHGSGVKLIRRRETYDDLIVAEAGVE